MSDVIKIIKKYNLKPATKRNLSLLNHSCCFYVYLNLINKTLGFTFKAVGSLGSHGKFHAMFNEDYVIKKTAAYIEKNKDIEKKSLKTVRDIYSKFLLTIEKANKIANKYPYECLNILIKFLPDYWLCLGTYNSFYRYLGDKPRFFSGKKINQLARERIGVASLYPKIDLVLKICLDKIGRKNNFRGELLFNMTYSEMRDFIKSYKISKDKLNELKKRAKGYFYYSIKSEHQEHIITEPRMLNKIQKTFFTVKKDNITILSGTSAYKGTARGYVYNLENLKHKNKKPIILVAVITQVEQTPLIKKCSGIVTDEGGLLSHTAIIARELRKPCIIGTKIATKVLHDGDMVEVDADKEVVKILKKARRG